MSFLLKNHDFLKYLHVGYTYYNIHTNHSTYLRLLGYLQIGLHHQQTKMKQFKFIN